MSEYFWIFCVMFGSLFGWFLLVAIGSWINSLISFTTDDPEFSDNHRSLAMVLMARLFGYKPCMYEGYVNGDGSKKLNADALFLLGSFVCLLAASIFVITETGNPAAFLFLLVVASPWIVRALIRRQKTKNRAKGGKTKE